MPVKEAPEEVAPFVPSPKLFHVLKESIEWGDSQEIDTVGALNDMITKYDMREVVLVQEAYQERQIAEIAKRIAGRKGREVCIDCRAFVVRKDNILTSPVHTA